MPDRMPPPARPSVSASAPARPDSTAQGTQRRVLVVGSSSVYFPEHDPSRSIPVLLQDALTSTAPEVSWEVTTALLYPTPSMRERASVLLRRHQPDGVFFVCSAIFAEDSILNRVRERWPRLYGPLNSLTKRLEGERGEPFSERGTAASRLLHLGRLAAGRLVGKAPLVHLEDAIEATKATLDVFAEVTGLGVICRLTNGGARDPSQIPEIRRRVDIYNCAIAAVCDSHGYPHLDTVASMQADGLEYTFEPDRIHGDQTAREYTVAWAAPQLVRLLQPSQGAPSTEFAAR